MAIHPFINMKRKHIEGKEGDIRSNRKKRGNDNAAAATTAATTTTTTTTIYNGNNDVDDDNNSNSNNNNNGPRRLTFLDLPEDVITIITSFGVEREFMQINRQSRGIVGRFPLNLPRLLVFSDHSLYDLKELVENECTSMVTSLVLRNSQLTDEKMLMLSKFIVLKTLSISFLTNITQVSFRSLPSVLRELKIVKSFLGDTSIANLHHLKMLRKLDITECNSVTGSTFNLLPNSLEELSITGFNILTDTGIGNLHSLGALKILKIDNTSGVTGASFSQLPESLEVLFLRKCTGLTDENLAGLRHLVKLKSLTVESSSIVGSTFDQLPTGLETLNLIKCHFIVDASVALLKFLVNLRSLTITDSSITGSEFNQLPISLESLTVTACDTIVADADMATIGRLKNLTYLYLSRIPTSRLTWLNSLPLSLTALYLHSMVITDIEVGMLSRLQSLRILSIQWNDLITGATFAQLPISLEELNFEQSTNIIGINIMQLQRLINLRKLTLTLNGDFSSDMSTTTTRGRGDSVVRPTVSMRNVRALRRVLPLLEIDFVSKQFFNFS